MQQKRRDKLVINLVFSQIILLILTSFATSFILSDNLASAQDPKIADFANARGISYEEALSRAITPIQTDSIKQVQQILTFKQPQTYEIKGKAFSEVIKKGDTFYAKTSTGEIKLDQARLEELKALGGNLDAPVEAYSYEAPFGLFTTTNFFYGNLLQGLVWSIAVIGVIQTVGRLAGADEELINTLSVSAAAGIIGGKALYGLFGAQTQGVVGSGGRILAQPWYGPLTGTLIGGVIAIGIFIALYSKEKKKLVKFQCLPFEPPLGGAKCEECNKDPFRPCSEYRCRSLGQACQILNPGTLEEKCAWVNPKDVTSPTIETWKDVLTKGLNYVPDSTIRPPNRGVKVVKGSSDCLDAFTPLEFGIVTNEPAQCKIDYTLTKTLDEMKFFFGGTNYYGYNHTQKMKLPGPDSGTVGELAPELKNDGTFSLFARCRDANGNENVDAFVFNFCVDPSPDTTPPIIEGTSIVQNGFVRFNADSTPIEVYVNEPAECKWSRQSKNYDDMENDMACDTEAFQINADLNYVCRGNLTGIKNNEENKFYFRCKDGPDKTDSERNVMVQSYELTLRGSQPLNILNVGPNGTIFGSTDSVSVELRVITDDGAEEGKAICYFSNTGEQDSYIAMFETNSFEHKQSLDLIAGDYEYFFRCIDAGGNSAEDNAEFSVVIDKNAPIVTRAYREEGLKIVTNEDAECVYSLNSCNYVFDEGLPLLYSNPLIKMNHFAEWQENRVYYIKCRDLYGNQPSPNDCSIVVRAAELGKK